MAQFPTRETEIAAPEQGTSTKDEALEGRKRGLYQASESPSETGLP